MSTPDPNTLKSRIGFIVELARRLHEYGTAAPRLEDAIGLVAARLGLVCNVLSTPTSIVMSFTDPAREDGLAEISQVIRMPPGEVDLKRLCQVDEIADQVIDGRLDLAEGRRRLREFGNRPLSPAARLLLVLSYGCSAGCIATVLNTGWTGAATAALIGLVIGLVQLAAAVRPLLAAASEAIAALLATLLATFVAARIAPLPLPLVIVASLIVLMPGMTLTTAVRELSSQHLISGTARLMGAVATLLKLAFGTAAAAQLCLLVGLSPHVIPALAMPGWAVWLAVLLGALAFAVLFRSPLRYVPAVVAAVVLGYLCTLVAGGRIAPAFGVFLGGLAVGAASNLFARVMRRPGAVVREPGIILLVPGSVAFRSLNFVFERDVLLGIDTAISLVILLLAIVAGLLFGDLLVPPRRKL